MSLTTVAKNIGIKHNVCIRVLDSATGEVVSYHEGHNAATNSMIYGVGNFIAGYTNDISGSAKNWVPKFISLGTMGLYNQDSDEEGLPSGIGASASLTEEENFEDYMSHCPGYGSDGYDANLINNRYIDGQPAFGLGPIFADRPQSITVDCELISERFPRSAITYRDVVPEYQAEYPQTIDVVLSAMVSVGALAQFRDSDKDYIYITEIGLWSRNNWPTNSDGTIDYNSGDNGMLAGYRIVPPDAANWDMSKEENRRILKENIIRVEKNQVAQIIWKIQLGGMDQISSSSGPGGIIEWEYF